MALCCRTPAKTNTAAHLSDKTDEATVAPITNVRKSIGEWEAGRADKTPSPPPTQGTMTLTAPTKQKKIVRSQESRLDIAWSPPASKIYKNRVDEAKACLLRAKTSLTSSRNLRTDVKAQVVAALDRMYQIVKEGEKDREKETGRDNERKEGGDKRAKDGIKEQEQGNGIAKEPTAPTTTANQVDNTATQMMKELVGELKEHRKALAECELFTLALTQKLDCAAVSPRPGSGTEGVSYATVAARRPVPARPPMHSIIVSSEDQDDTSSNVVEIIRAAVDAKESGIRVDKLRKVKNQRVVVGCQTKKEIEQVASRLRGSSAKLKVEEAVTRDPLVVLTNVLNYNTDDDITKAIQSQNSHLLRGLQPEEIRTTIKYRKRARNPHENHVVLQVSPKVWQRLTEAECIHVDLQRIRVHDQTPLIQCTRCLRFGHGRKLCTEERDLCSHCGGPHLRADCEARLAGEPPSCRNCSLAKHEATGHNAFSADCPVHKKWDAIARSSVAYC